MPDLYLHAGAPKTGTSFLQMLFARHADRLDEAGILYPRGHMFDEAKAGEITSGNGVELANYLRPNLPHQIADKEGYIRQFSRILQSARGKHVLFSSEYLIFPDGPKTAAVAAAAAQYNYTPKYVYLVRDIDQAAFSTYSQQVKRSGETKSFGEYIVNWEPLYRHSILNAEKGFGDECIVAYNYEEWRDRLSELFFSEILGAGFTPDEKVVVNRSLSPKETELQRLMNAFAPNNVAFATYISDALMKLERKREPMVLTRDEAAFLQKKFAPAVEYVNKFVRGRPTVVCSSDVVPERPPVAVSDFERAMLSIVAKLVGSVTK
ncbi:hypothetical protein [Aquibium oceanicum]|uniref:Sulfotransferase domain-containing protein n=1 Tax=Aquibium oceanicum TaxID=1670800 RepID=A0A1L3ST21_9HYPH|nr:hypothetical protein [Aquibium oceanicum]APH72583.1 hypothetical protein BSQ44_15365 [Aquibium oceanicum]